jgi:leucyl aminopeptidase
VLVPECPGVAAGRLLLVGLGARASFNARAWRKTLHAAVSALTRTRVGSVAFALERPASGELDDYYFGRAVAEICASTLYRINDLKSARRAPAPPLARLSVGPVASAALPRVRRGLAAGAALGESLSLVRNLANLPANVCTPRYLARRARELAAAHRGRMRARIFDAAQIRRLGMGCLLAVTRGSAEPPRFIVLEYRGARSSAAPVVLVGKGVTFDTGGISLKDPQAMDEMKFDMCGAATVLGALDYAARSALSLNVVGLVPACENMPGGRAIKPGDIVTSASGQTVEILNTDAEGRLILCDALDYARRYRPAAVVDFATLTGACVIALGHHQSAIMGNDAALENELAEAGTRSADWAWRMPLTEDYAEQLRSNFADMANVAGRDGGAITAAAFLGKFTGGLPWAHLDIAGTAWHSGKEKGASGRPLSLVADFLAHRAGAVPGR